MLAALVNTRGLTEIVIITVGLQEHILDTGRYALMIVMALVTTAMTGPLLSWCELRSRTARDVGAAGHSVVGAGSLTRWMPRRSAGGVRSGPRARQADTYYARRAASR